ncbi:MAG: class II aldolase/adducin family protein [Anaerolineae bacterium]|nr:class II aldolase/adducin family protein [Anaerolineae bacterium]
MADITITRKTDTLTEQEARAAIAELGGLLFARQLTNTAGGNLSVRVGDRVFLSPRYAGSKYQWHLTPAQVIAVDLNDPDAESTPGFSREGKAHLGLYRAFPEAGGVIHAHPRWVTVFASASASIPPVLEYTQKFGVVEAIPYAPSHSQTLADNIVAAMLAQKERFKKNGLALVLPTHGMIAMGRDLADAFDVVERADVNAMCVILGRLIA